MPKLTISPAEPDTPEGWRLAVDAADALLELDSARLHGLVRGGPDVDAERCWEVLHRAREEHGIEPSEDAVERCVSELLGSAAEQDDGRGPG